LKSQIKEQATQQGYKLIPGSEQVRGGQLYFYYQSPKYQLELGEEGIEGSDKPYDNYNLAIYRR
jgi:hypothetical protein